MTFETSRKKQVLVLQPRGKALYEDDSSFGSKMLAKMGWTKGNGLGKQQNGNRDFIQIRYKNNANGLGFDGLKDNQWTDNEFDNLLKSLNGNSDSNSGSPKEQEESGSKSLEEMSKASRARVHYKKFTRGKDVHKYSEKDLANILGKKSLTEIEVKPENEEKQVECNKPDMYDSNLIVNTGLTVTDYFKQKMKSKSKNERTIDQSDILENPKDEPTVDQKDNEEKPKKRKKRRHSDDDNQEKPLDEIEVKRLPEIVQISSFVAQKLSYMTVDSFKNSNISNIVGYGLSEDIEIKIVQTKAAESLNTTDKYSLYNMDRLTTKHKSNPRKIISKLKKMKKSIQVI